MTAVERLEALKTVDIKEIDRDSLPKYKDLISELDSRKSNKMEVLLNHSDNFDTASESWKIYGSESTVWIFEA